MKYVNILVLFIFSISISGQIPNTLSVVDKIYGLSKFWQEVNYNFIYLDKLDREQWDTRYRDFITTVQNTKNDYEYYRELQKFCALLKDGHTNIYFPRGIEQLNTMFGDYRIFIQNIDDKPIIIRTNFSKKNEIPLGSEVIEVNGKTTENYISQNLAPYISSSTDYVLRDICLTRLLSGMEGEIFNIKIKKPDNQILELTLTHKKTEEKEVYPEFEPERQLLDFRWINDRMAYIALNSFGDQKIVDLFIDKLPELYQAKSLIIDLRYNTGGNENNGAAILEYLTNDKILYGSKNSSRQHIPSFKAWGKLVKVSDTASSEWYKKAYLSYHDKFYYNFDYEPYQVKLDAKRVVVPTCLLIGHNTASAAENFLIYADNQKHMTKIGENSYGSSGQPYTFDLPGGGSARICTKKDTYPDGREFVGYGIKPDIIVKPSLSDLRNQKDPVLEKAIEYLQQNKRK